MLVILKETKYCTVSTYAGGILIRRANVLHNTKYVTSDKFQQAELQKKRNFKQPQGTVISINEVWHHILKYQEVITNLNFVTIQFFLLETRTGKSPRNPYNPNNNNFTRSGANVTDNSKNMVRSPNELRQSLSTNRHFSESQYEIHKHIQLYNTSCKLHLIVIFSLRPPELMIIFDMV